MCFRNQNNTMKRLRPKDVFAASEVETARLRLNFCDYQSHPAKPAFHRTKPFLSQPFSGECTLLRCSIMVHQRALELPIGLHPTITLDIRVQVFLNEIGRIKHTKDVCDGVFWILFLLILKRSARGSSCTRKKTNRKFRSFPAGIVSAHSVPPT